jgi:hypothetical protein
MSVKNDVLQREGTKEDLPCGSRANSENRMQGLEEKALYSVKSRLC